jgi:hypothetical protein
VRIIHPSAVGGLAKYLQMRRREIMQHFLSRPGLDNEVWGLFMHVADETPIDGGPYDDPHKPKARRDVDSDLDGWEPIR